MADHAPRDPRRGTPLGDPRRLRVLAGVRAGRCRRLTAAWLVTQRAIEDVGLQKRCLEALEGAVAYGDADPVHLAYLLDRVRMADGRDQLYGSQFVLDERGDLVPWPVDDPAAVDARRLRLGLPKFTEHAATMAEQWRARSDRS